MHKTRNQSQALTPLWRMALHQPHIDADDIAGAIDEHLRSGDLDYRTRLLIRRSAEALRDVWPADRYREWIGHGPDRERLSGILSETFDEDGFTSLGRSVVMSTKPETVKQFLRELGMLLPKPTRIVVGGSIALILRDLLVRQTEDIDIVNEVPVAIRELGEPLRNLVGRYRLTVSHFQSHYLPAGWEERVQSFEMMRNLDVVLIDPYDIFVGKLFSRREKDREDLRVLASELDKERIVRRLADARSMLAVERLRAMAAENWYVIFGEELPAAGE